MSDPIHYVVGLAMDRYGRVVMIRKERPEWQKGLLNGIGGKVEYSESIFGAMVREFHEETGVTLTEWEEFLTIHAGNHANIYFFRILNLDPSVTERCHTNTDEEVSLVDVESLARHPHWMVPNLQWVIPLARYQGDVYDPIHVRLRSNV